MHDSVFIISNITCLPFMSYRWNIIPHTIHLLRIDYAGFLLISCNKSDRHELQVIQNDALRTCYNVKRQEKLSISSMHKRANLLSLEQRRSLQLLSLMYLHKEDAQNLIVANRHTRAAACDQFHVDDIILSNIKTVHFTKDLNYGNYYQWTLLHPTLYFSISKQKKGIIHM